MKALSDVCVVIYGAAGSTCGLDRTLDAVDAQDSPPNGILIPATETQSSRESASRVGAVVSQFPHTGSDSPFAAGVRAAASSGARWLWLLDGVTIPEPDALSALLAVIGELGESETPALVASKVVDEFGQLHPDAIPRHEVFEKERTVQAAARCIVHLRTACHGSLLIRRTAVERLGLPHPNLPPGIDIADWSARLLRRREDAGYLVPASVAVRSPNALETPPSPRPWLSRLRLLAGGGAWSPTERLWEAFLLSEEALARRRKAR